MTDFNQISQNLTLLQKSQMQSQLFMKFAIFFAGVLTHQTKNRDRTELNLKTSPENCPL